jgi:hypothetical protein
LFLAPPVFSLIPCWVLIDSPDGETVCAPVSAPHTEPPSPYFFFFFTFTPIQGEEHTEKKISFLLLFLLPSIKKMYNLLLLLLLLLRGVSNSNWEVGCSPLFPPPPPCCVLLSVRPVVLSVVVPTGGDFGAQSVKTHCCDNIDPNS